ncbi:hypothetical protein ACU8KH_03696 [Lachancea thermotolerans]
MDIMRFECRSPRPPQLGTPYNEKKEGTTLEACMKRLLEVSLPEYRALYKEN